jgi:hypothetical protein
MPLTKVNFRPGINKQDTDYGAEGGWTDADFIRFRYGLPEKIGGWTEASTSTLIGIARAQFSWFTLDQTRYTGLGTNKKLYVMSEGTVSDITPLRSTASAATSAFTTSASSANVTCTVAAHGAEQGDFVTVSSVSLIPGTSSLSASDFQGEFEIQSITDSNNFIITLASTETGTPFSATGTGTFEFQLNTGPAASALGYGWGTAAWGDSTWGTERSTSTTVIQGANWSLDNWGEDLIATYRDGATYQWDSSAGTGTRATRITNSPYISRFSMVSVPDRHLICFGTQTTIATSGNQDTLYFRWATQESLSTDAGGNNAWTPTATNTAGSLRIGDGSKIIGSTKSRGAILVWTDTSLHGLQYIGPPYTFGLQTLGANCGLVAQHACVDVRGISFWMSQNGFFMYDGAVKQLACSVQDYVFDTLDPSGQNDIYAGVNTDFHEVIWFYPDTTAYANFNNRYVIFNYADQVWSVGTMDRTTWFDRGVYANPYATEYLPNSVTNVTPTIVAGLSNGVSAIFKQEDGNNGNGAAITSFVQSADFDISDEQAGVVMAVRKFIPDFKNQTGNVNIIMQYRNYPTGSASSNSSNSLIETTTTYVDVRGRGRTANVKFISDTTDSTWRFGTFRLDLQPDGRR